MTEHMALRSDQTIPPNHQIMARVTCPKGDGEFNIIHHTPFADRESVKKEIEHLNALLLGDHVDNNDYQHSEVYDLSDL